MSNIDNDGLILQRPTCNYFKKLVELSKTDKVAVNSLQVYLPKSDEALIDQFQCLLDWDYEAVNVSGLLNLSPDNVSNNYGIFKGLVLGFINKSSKFVYLTSAVKSFIKYVEKKYDDYYARLNNRLIRSGYENHNDGFALIYFKRMQIVCGNFKEVKNILLEE